MDHVLEKINHRSVEMVPRNNCVVYYGQYMETPPLDSLNFVVCNRVDAGCHWPYCGDTRINCEDCRCV